MLVTLKEILSQANAEGRAIASFNTFGIEYVSACIAAAEELDTPVILSINMDMMDYMPIEPYVALLLKMAEPSSATICIHLDHCYEKTKVIRAMDAGVTSVMFDGSQLSLEENIENTAWVVDKAQAYGLSVEAELGSVPYSTGRDHIISALTEPEQVAVFCRESGCDALAVSIGNIHRLVDHKVEINYSLLEAIEKNASVPLVVHGASGIEMADIQRLSTTTTIAKCNIGTALRTCWYAEVARVVAGGQESDTLGVICKIIPAMKQQCISYMSTMMSEQLKESQK